MFIEFLFILVSFLIGAIPFGYILVKAKTGKNIQKYGSGNIGSTNVRRIAGKKIAFLTQIADILKGMIPTALSILYLGNDIFRSEIDILSLMVAFACILGHNFTPFLKFKGGKGVNTSMGASFIIDPYTTLISFVVYVLVKLSLKRVSVGSLFIAVSLPLVSWFMNDNFNVFSTDCLG